MLPEINGGYYSDVNVLHGYLGGTNSSDHVRIFFTNYASGQLTWAIFVGDFIVATDYEVERSRRY